jgi:RhoGAP domain
MLQTLSLTSQTNVFLAPELDVDLFNEPDLYDINIIGSMFKAWLRELPDEIFPKATQARIAEKCMGATETPQLLKDELSKLPPFNYYLLFAITCHLSLLHSFVERNKMDYRNLCICFQPCLKIDGFCFQFLVCDWKNCWQGCWTEKEALIEEYRVLDGRPSLNPNIRVPTPEERTVSSSHSSKQSISTNDIKVDPSPLSPKSSNEDGVQHTQATQRPHPSLSPISPVSPMHL